MTGSVIHATDTAEIEDGSRKGVLHGEGCIKPMINFDTLTASQAQRAEAILNKISYNINKTHTGLISVIQGFQKYIAWNLSN